MSAEARVPFAPSPPMQMKGVHCKFLHLPQTLPHMSESDTSLAFQATVVVLHFVCAKWHHILWRKFKRILSYVLVWSRKSSDTDQNKTTFFETISLSNPKGSLEVQRICLCLSLTTHICETKGSITSFLSTVWYHSAVQCLDLIGQKVVRTSRNNTVLRVFPAAKFILIHSTESD